MRRRNILLCCALFLLSNGSGIAQKKKFCPAPPPSPFKHSGEIVTSFDATARVMRTTLEHPRPLGGGEASFYLKASFIHQNTNKQTLELLLVSASRTPKMNGVKTLVLVCDGKTLPQATAANYVSRGGNNGLTIEALRLTLSAGDVAGLANARKVTARVGSNDYELTNNHLEALREMASLMAVSAPRWRTE